MLDDLKARLTRRRALKRVRDRTVRPWNPDPAQRRVLLVLPADDGAAKEAWRFVDGLGLDPALVTPVRPAGAIATPPAGYIGRVEVLAPTDLDRLGLPKRSFTERVWASGPDVALCLADPSDLASVVLAAASPAAFRIGLHSVTAVEDPEPLFDLAVTGEGALSGVLEGLGETLAKIRPPVLAEQTQDVRGARPVG